MIIKAAIERFTLSGRLRVTLRPLMNQLPLIGSGGWAQGAGAPQGLPGQPRWALHGAWPATPP